MKELNEEEIYPLSGWDNIEENLSYSEIYIKQLQQQLNKVVNSKLPPSSSLPNRTHIRNKSKDYFSTKLSNGHFKRDKEFLQQYIKRQNACEPAEQSSYFQDNSPEERLKYQPEIMNLTSQKHQHHKTAQIIINATKSPEEGTGLLEKYILFSGINKQKCTKRRFFLKVNPRQISQKCSKDLNLSSRKPTKISQKFNLFKMDQTTFQRPEYYGVHKKGLKFPLFYRQLHSNQQYLRKDKYKSTINIRQKMELKFSDEFTDDNIFQTRFIRA